MKVGNDNLFQSSIFSNTVSTLLHSEIEVINTTGAVGAAQASGIGVGIFTDIKEATAQREVVKKYEPNDHFDQYLKGYNEWEEQLKKHLN